MVRRVLVAVRDMAYARELIPLASALARCFEAEVTAVHVVVVPLRLPLDAPFEEAERGGEEVLALASGGNNLNVRKEAEMVTAYPKEVELRDGTKVTLRPMVKEDGEKLFQFFTQLPEEDRLYLREDVTKKEVIEGWIRDLNYHRIFPLLAEFQGQIMGDATLHRREYGWTRHTAKVRVTIARIFQHRGLGTKMVQELIGIATQEGLEKVLVELMAGQTVALRAFEKMGFRKVAMLPELVKDLTGRYHDLVVLVYNIPPEEEVYEEELF